MKRRLTSDERGAIRMLYCDGVSSHRLARHFAVSRKTIQCAIRGLPPVCKGGGRPEPGEHEEREAKVLLEHGFEPHDIADYLKVRHKAVERLKGDGNGMES